MKLLTIISGLAMLVSMASGAAVSPRQSPANGDAVSLFGGGGRGRYFPESRWGWCARGYWCYSDYDCRRLWPCLRETWGDPWSIYCGTHRWPHSCYFYYDWSRKGGLPPKTPVPFSATSGGSESEDSSQRSGDGGSTDSQPTNTAPSEAPSETAQAFA
ncbi:hypothetical protein GX50_00942 [[Emmonsia] crescens]|uniref:Uncharacterized protein n=1 Tax=[Emmonsia] crescens TaxID=73230 RepID=A0A2B7ZU28_9EURO|nr:hypothetical protein GX50_00942 [Emmonsia crescens]